MDAPIPKNRRKSIAIALMSLLLLAAVGVMVWHYLPKGLQVNATDLRIATVSPGQFLDETIVRAYAAPLVSVVLDSVESGRVEEVFAVDGGIVRKGTPLFRLSNPQRQIELLARQSDQATQISNISNLRAALELSKTDHQRRLADLQFNVQQAAKKVLRQNKLAEQGFVSTAALEEAQDALDQQQHALDQELIRSKEELGIKQAGIAQLGEATERLTNGLKLLAAQIDALTVKAPTDGRLTDFHLQVGVAVTPGQRIGRIDDPDRFKLTAAVDEYYLNRVTVGLRGKTEFNGQQFPVEVSSIYPQITKGQFTVELRFQADQSPRLSPGQSMDTRITLGNATPALLLPNGAFINDTGGTWAYVLSGDQRIAERRELRIGRRSGVQLEILSGLKAGEHVIVSGYAAFGAAQRLQLNSTPQENARD